MTGQALGSITKANFGKLADGTPVHVFTLKNAKGAEARITDYGGIVVSLKVPDRKGDLADVVLGYDTLDAYVAKNPYFGCLVGRYGNRIAKGRFKLGDTLCSLATNNGPNHLHGGIKGFDKVVWQAAAVNSEAAPTLVLTHVSPDGDEGYPGSLSVKALYSLTEDNALKIEFVATTDKPTVCNLTHHSYFNLAGSGDILKHSVMIAADQFLPVDATLIPTGELRPVKGTPFDFTKPTAIGARINDKDEQLAFGNGYDHNWILRKKQGELCLAARVIDHATGRVMDVFTTDPGLQFYTGNFLDGSNVGKGGVPCKFRTGFCMEPQHYPDSPNKPAFPSTTLLPGQTYRHTVIYKFSVRK